MTLVLWYQDSLFHPPAHTTTSTLLHICTNRYSHLGFILKFIDFLHNIHFNIFCEYVTKIIKKFQDYSLWCPPLGNPREKEPDRTFPSFAIRSFDSHVLPHELQIRRLVDSILLIQAHPMGLCWLSATYATTHGNDAEFMACTELVAVGCLANSVWAVSFNVQ